MEAIALTKIHGKIDTIVFDGSVYTRKANTLIRLNSMQRIAEVLTIDDSRGVGGAVPAGLFDIIGINAKQPSTSTGLKSIKSQAVFSDDVTSSDGTTAGDDSDGRLITTATATITRRDVFARTVRQTI